MENDSVGLVHSAADASGTSSNTNNRSEQLVRYWVAQVLSTPSAWREGWCPHDKQFDKRELLHVLGFTTSREGRLRQPPKALAKVIAERPLAQLLVEDDIYRNLSRLGERLSLTEAERRLIAFSSYMEVSQLLYQACELIIHCSARQVMKYLARFIDMPEGDVRQALAVDGVLRTSSLLTLSHSRFRSTDLTGMLQVESELQEILQHPDAPESLLTSFFYRVSEPATLSLDDFVEYADEVGMLQRLLSRAVEQKRTGINLLIYGPPGTGKTQLVRALAESLGYALAMVPETDRDGDGISASARLGRYSACQRALVQDKHTLVAFDEAEDCLCDNEGFSFFAAPRQTHKPGVIRLLESNPLPTVWISNRVEMDPAFLRRFTHVVQIANPGSQQRHRLVAEALEGVPVSAAFIERAAKLKNVSPAILHSSLEFARLAGEGEQDVERLMSHSLNARFEAAGRTDRLRMGADAGLPWRAECLRASEDVAALIDEINPDAAVRFCLHGAPGTGKTAWAQELANRLGRPLMVRQAAELLDMYVGNSEKLIAAAFSEAEREGAVLVIDEADSFIGSRREATKSWEVSQVNQFLASMENYQGIFVATTNLLDRVDEAAMRRFDFVIRFDYLDEQGAILLLRDLAEAYNIRLPRKELLSAMLHDLKQLTPGDFAAIYRRLKVRKKHPDAAGLVMMLRDSCSYKKGESKPIGFVATAVH